MKSLRLTGLIITVLILSACDKKEPSPESPKDPPSRQGVIEQISMPTVEVPIGKKRKLLKHKPEALPKGAKARYPIYDGQPFHITFPINERDKITSKEVFVNYLVPVLTAVGFDPDKIKESFFLPSKSGVNYHRADTKGLMDQMNDEYRRNPKLLRPKTKEMLDVLSGRSEGNITESVSKALQMGEGMTLNQYIAGIERLEIAFPFQQVVRNVPIEHTLVTATRWQGQGIHSVYGAFFNRYKVANEIKIDRHNIGKSIADSLLKVNSIASKLNKKERVLLRKFRVKDGPHLVLLPYGTDSNATTQMHYAYRMVVQTHFMGQRDFKFMLWIDASNANILKLNSLTHQATSARAEVFNRGPDVGTYVRSMQVDDASGGSYQLSLSGVMNRVDYMDNGFDANDVTISDSANGSSATLANFNQAPINNELQALCLSGTNKTYQQLNFFTNIYKYRSWTLANGIFTPFPSSAWSPRVESTSAGCNAWSSMNFGVCTGYSNADCPDYVGGSSSWSNRAINTALDNTWVAHELGHSITPRYTSSRPANWCGPGPCAIPLGWGTFHDLADFWADHFESTNCWSPWLTKNMGGLDANLNCISTTSESGGVPRLHEIDIPFNPADPKDHFPEHRDIGSGPYSEMQIGTAALWQVRLGMRSKCRPSGTPQFAVRFARALKRTGFFVNSESNDRRIYDFLYDLESMMADEWATAGSPGGAPAFRHNGSHTLNKVTGGFAATGLFLIPGACVDSDATTADPGYCPGGEFGGDAVVDIDDNDSADDLSTNGVIQKEVDFLELGGAAPSFNVWTGPRYRFDASGNETLSNPAPCNTQYNVQVSTSDTFPGASTQESGWQNVDVNPGNATVDCFASWTPNNAQWTALQSGGDGSFVYYRVRTRDAGGINERVSTEPANGLWTVPAPYAVMTTNGLSDY